MVLGEETGFKTLDAMTGWPGVEFVVKSRAKSGSKAVSWWLKVGGSRMGFGVGVWGGGFEAKVGGKSGSKVVFVVLEVSAGISEVGFGSMLGVRAGGMAVLKSLGVITGAREIKSGSMPDMKMEGTAVSKSVGVSAGA